MAGTDKPGTTWNFLTNHAHVLMCLVQQPELLMREIAQKVGITERAVQRIIADLRNEGYITMQREGRRNVYQINPEARLKHPIESHRRLADLIKLIYPDQQKKQKQKQN